MEMTPEETKSALQSAVSALKKGKVIKADKDITELTGYKKSAVSLYVNGTAPISDDFKEKFEEVFKLKLENYKPEKEGPTFASTGNSQNNTYQEKYIALLEETREEYKKEISSLRKELIEIKQSLDAILKNQSTMDATMEAGRNIVLKKLAKTPEELSHLQYTVRIDAAAIESDNMKRGNLLIIDKGSNQ